MKMNYNKEQLDNIMKHVQGGESGRSDTVPYLVEQARLAIEMAEALEFLVNNFVTLGMRGDVYLCKMASKYNPSQGATPLEAIQLAMKTDKESSTKQ